MRRDAGILGKRNRYAPLLCDLVSIPVMCFGVASLSRVRGKDNLTVWTETSNRRNIHYMHHYIHYVTNKSGWCQCLGNYTVRNKS